MKEEIATTIAGLPLANLIVLGIIILCVLGFFVYLAKHFGVIQIGTFSIRKEQEGQTTMYNMNEENKDADDYLQQKLRQMTNTLRQRIVNMFASYTACAMTKRSLSSCLRYPLYESIGNNHFTKELMNERYEKYRLRILDLLKDEYVDLCSNSGETECGHNELPDWSGAKQTVEQFLDMWLLETANLVQDCARMKLETYDRYLPIYQENKDTYRATIVSACVEKNKHYIDSLERLTEHLLHDIRDREKTLPGEV